MVQYVRVNGDDSRDGQSEYAAKKTVKAALAALPKVNGNSCGTIYLGRGVFCEYSTLYINTGVTLIGEGTGTPNGSVIAQASGFTGPLISHSDDFANNANFSHNLTIRDLTLLGTPTGGDLLRIWNGGFNCTVDNVVFENSGACGAVIKNLAVNVMLRNISGYNCADSAVYYEITGPNGILSIEDAQIDNCGTHAIRINQTAGCTGSGNLVTIRRVKTECWQDGKHLSVINFSPRPAMYGNPVLISVDGMSADSVSPGKTAVVLEESQPGVPALFNLNNILTTGTYPNTFLSRKRNLSFTQTILTKQVQ